MARDEHVAQLRKGVLELAILSLLQGRARYGGEIVDELARRPGLEARAGTVYPLLTRLRTAGLVSTRWQESPAGPPRKYYELTAAGRQEMRTLAASWQQLTTALTGLLAEADA